MIKELEALLAKVTEELYGLKIEVDFYKPDPKFGDIATSFALKLKDNVDDNPRMIAEKIVQKLDIESNDAIKSAIVAGPGFINFILTDVGLFEMAMEDPKKPLKNKTIVIEYSDPNPFKVLHAGHLFTSVVGDAIANILEFAGAKVHRVNYGGDVGLHVAKTMWAVVQKLGGENPAELNKIDEDDRSNWLANCYILGTKEYEKNVHAKNAIIELNKRIYSLHEKSDHSSDFAKIYWTCREWSYQYFKEFYRQIGSQFEKFYTESEVSEIGLKTVNQHIGSVYKKSEGAVIYQGERHGLHTRVFITKDGLPTYETKDIGLVQAKAKDYKFDQSIIITANEQAGYMKVVLKSLEEFEPKLANSTIHLTHGMVKLAGSKKMSSRVGNFLRAQDVLEEANSANKKVNKSTDVRVSLCAVKYSFLTNRLGGDIVFDPKDSVKVEGKSGPYLQYALVRAKSILSDQNIPNKVAVSELTPAERGLLSKIADANLAINQSITDLMPHHIANYLYELSAEFNKFYETSRVLGDKREKERLHLVDVYSKVLETGLRILNIPTVEKM